MQSLAPRLEERERTTREHPELSFSLEQLQGGGEGLHGDSRIQQNPDTEFFFIAASTESTACPLDLSVRLQPSKDSILNAML